MNLAAEPAIIRLAKFYFMKILNDTTPTSELTAVKVGDQISNRLGTFGEVAEIKFDNEPAYWQFTFVLTGGGLIEVIKTKNSCSL